ncbi:hypothetical protein J3A83DRAFT_4185221 [Scleroderma citrinum]
MHQQAPSPLGGQCLCECDLKDESVSVQDEFAIGIEGLDGGTVDYTMMHVNGTSESRCIMSIMHGSCYISKSVCISALVGIIAFCTLIKCPIISALVIIVTLHTPISCPMFISALVVIIALCTLIKHSTLVVIVTLMYFDQVFQQVH